MAPPVVKPQFASPAATRGFYALPKTAFKAAKPIIPKKASPAPQPPPPDPWTLVGLPSQQDYVSGQLAPVLAQIKAMQEAHDQQVAAQQAAVQALTAQFINELQGIPGALGNAYQTFHDQQVASGAEQAKSLAAANPDSQTQAILAAIGAPAEQKAALGNLDQQIFTGGGAVLQGVGGTLPAGQTSAQELADAVYAAKLPQIGGEYGLEGMQQVLAAARQGQQQIDQLQAQAVGQTAGLGQDWQNQLYQRQNDLQSRAMSLYNSGLITQRQLAQQLGLPGWQKYPATTRASSQSPIVTDGHGGHRLVIDPTTGKITDLGPKAAPKTANLTYKNIGGELYGVDPATGKKVVDVGPAGSPKASASSVQKPSGDFFAYNPALNGGKGGYQLKPGYVFGPNGVVVKNGKPKPNQILGPAGTPMTATDIRNASNDVLDTIYGIDPNTKARGKATRPLESVIAAMQQNQVPNAIWVPIIVRAYKIPQNPNQIKYMSVGRLHNLATLIAPADFANALKSAPQRVVNGKTTRAFNKQELLNFVQSHLENIYPKGEAATKTAAYKTANLDYPLATVGRIIGYPYQGTHTMYGNWESDNAIDISTPNGTPVYALADGTIGSQIGALNSGDPHLLGLRVHLQFGNNEAYYAHLSKLVVKAGQKVKAGQLIGYSGSANGVQHLHIALKNGNPAQLLTKPKKVVV